MTVSRDNARLASSPPMKVTNAERHRLAAAFCTASFLIWTPSNATLVGSVGTANVYAVCGLVQATVFVVLEYNEMSEWLRFRHSAVTGAGGADCAGVVATDG